MFLRDRLMILQSGKRFRRGFLGHISPTDFVVDRPPPAFQERIRSRLEQSSIIYPHGCEQASKRQTAGSISKFLLSMGLFER
jgi:hypothetical protein